MNTKQVFLLLITVLGAGLTHAQGVTCKPVLNQNRWKEANVEYLVNASQVLYHVRATGNFLTADLLCSVTSDTCVGFAGGVQEIKGQIQRSPTDLLQVVGISFESMVPDRILPAAEFTCK